MVDIDNNELRQRSTAQSEPVGTGADQQQNQKQVNFGGVTFDKFDYGSAEAYATSVRNWLLAYQGWYMAQCMAPLYMQHALAVQQQVRTQAGTVITPPTVLQGGQQHIVAAYGRRLLAETIDFIFCFILKLMVVYIMVEMHFIDLDRYERLLSDQADLQTLIDVTQDLFPIEMANKLLTSLIEALYISYGFGSVLPGCTPGKYLMGLRVVACKDVRPLAPRDYRVIIDGVARVTFGQSLIRSLLKNFTLSFLFPLCLTMYAFRYNRSLYDIASGTIVIES